MELKEQRRQIFEIYLRDVRRTLVAVSVDDNAKQSMNLTALDIVVMAFSTQLLEIREGVQSSLLELVRGDLPVGILVYITQNSRNNGICFSLMRLVVCGELLRIYMVYAVDGLDFFTIPTSVAVQIMKVEEGLDVEGVTAVPL